MEMTYNNILLLPKQKQTIEKGFDDAFQITDLPYTTPCHNCCYTLECSSYKPDTKFQIIPIVHCYKNSPLDKQ